MATHVDTKTEKFYEFEVKRRRVRANGRGYEPFWKVKTVQDAIVDGDTEFRCQHCHGAVKVHKRLAASGSMSHAAHKLKVDAEYCAGGVAVRESVNGLTARFSCEPIL